MASTWSSLKIQLMGAGDENGTWGTVTNANLGTVIEEAITGSSNVTFASADVTLTLTDSTASQTARNLRLNLTGTSGGARNLIVPAIEKVYIVNNGLADAVTVKNSTGSGIAVPAGKTMYVFNNGTNVVDAITHLSSLTLTSALPAGSGGTGLTSPGTSGNVLTSNGTTWTSSAGFVTGMIMLWSGSVGTVPSGWQICDGTNGTPDLRNRFIVGAGSTYAVNATGGSADAIVVSHTHTISTTVNSDSTLDGTFPTASLQTNYSGPFTQGTQISGNGANAAPNHIVNFDGTHSHTASSSATTTGSSGTNANLPPYYALAYIMKL